MWKAVLDFGLTLWVVRPAVIVLILGGLLMWFIPQAQDLLIELASPASSWSSLASTSWLLVLVFVVWAMPTHYSARLLLRNDTRYQAKFNSAAVGVGTIERWIPRVLGMLTFVVILGGVYRAWLNLPVISDASEIARIDTHLVRIAVAVVFAGAVFLIYTIEREKLAQTRPIVAAEKLTATLKPNSNSAAAPLTVSTGALGYLSLIALFVVFAILPIVDPAFFARLFPRVFSIPFVLGGWLPLLALLAAVGRRFHAPLILGAYLLITLLPWVLGDNYAIRRTPPAPGSRSIELQEAIDLWKKANDCTASTCPRPIIIAAAGGASRAAFFTTGVIGQLLDDTLRVGSRTHGLSPAKMSNRIFALSTVSGSSVGAAMTVAAMAASQDGRQPCRASDPAGLWEGDKIDNWRSCLEALTSGDFLTPIFTGFVFHDLFGFVHSLLPWPDRGTLLERAVEQRFASLISRNPNVQTTLCNGTLDCPFLSLRPTEEHWIPILLLNSTSVRTGQRVIETALEWHIDLKDNVNCPNSVRGLSCQIFADAFNLDQWPVSIGNPPKQSDIRVSTAAHNSARFPLLSPPGAVLDDHGRMIDRLVDGGYFENFGAQTATELAMAMRALDEKLKPFILVLSNDPEIVLPKQADETQSAAVLLSDVFGPLDAVTQTRNARGQLAVQGAANALDHSNDRQCNMAWLRVWSERDLGRPGAYKARSLSMSWWLSKPVQRYLNEQTDPTAGALNRNAIALLLDAVADKALDGGRVGQVQCSSEPER